MPDPTTNSHDDVVEALQLTAGALQCIADRLSAHEHHIIRFTGQWERFGTLSIGEILDRANTALEPYHA